MRVEFKCFKDFLFTKTGALVSTEFFCYEIILGLLGVRAGSRLPGLQGSCMFAGLVLLFKLHRNPFDFTHVLRVLRNSSNS